MSHQQIFNVNCRRLTKEDFSKPCKELAVYLLGKILVRKLESGDILVAKIVETESYLGGDDKASHSYNGKLTKRNEPMYMPAGTAFVYVLYFGYHCFNISSLESGAVVLIRALEPISGIDIMHNNRVTKGKSAKKTFKSAKLCDGPSKLCIAMDVTKENSNKLDLANPQNNYLWLEDSIDFDEATVINTTRVGIGASAQEWVAAPLRYYLFNNKSVSKRDKKAENAVYLINNDKE